MGRAQAHTVSTIGWLAALSLLACGSEEIQAGAPTALPNSGTQPVSMQAAPAPVGREPAAAVNPLGPPASDLMRAGAAIAGAGGATPSMPSPDPTPAEPVPMFVDPGTGPWEPVAPSEVAEVCRLDPALLEMADQQINLNWGIVRYGRLCHEYYPGGSDTATGTASAGKTFGGLTMGALAYQSRDIPRTGPKTGPLSDADRMDYWLDDFGSFRIHADALAAHVLGMVSYNSDLSYGAKEWSYDGDASREVNAFNGVAQAVLAQDPMRLGADLEAFAQKFVMQPLGLEDTVWNDGQPTKRFGGGWTMLLKDMARIGLLMLNGGVWNGERLVSEEWIYRMTHPSFEDASTSYGYVTWLATKSNWRSYTGGRQQEPIIDCVPSALWNAYPHSFSDAPDCNYNPPYECTQMYDAGVWFAAGAGGQYVFGHPGLDMVVVVKDAGMDAAMSVFWNRVVPAIVALDPSFQGDRDAFCEAYGNNRYAPDLRPRKAP
jgi:hypothetical protein